MVEATPAARLPEVFDQRNLSLAEASVNALDALGVLPAWRAQRRDPPHPCQPQRRFRPRAVARRRLRPRGVRPWSSRATSAMRWKRACECLPNLQRHRPAFPRPRRNRWQWRRIASPTGMRGTHRFPRACWSPRTASTVRSAPRSASARSATITPAPVRRAPARRDARRRHRLYERFGDHGPTALLPRGDRHFGLVHAVAEREADEVASLDDRAPPRVQRAFGWRLGTVPRGRPRSDIGATRRRRCAACAARVLVGNAAQGVHPVSAQGFNLGLRDALTLAEMLWEARRHRRSLRRPGSGPGQSSERYARRRRRPANARARSPVRLSRFTANQELAALRARSVGSRDRSPSLQARPGRRAMGYRGDVPALCRARA